MRRALWFLIICAALAVVAPARAQLYGSGTVATPPPPTPPGSGNYLGAFCNDGVHSHEVCLENLESTIGRTLAIQTHYYSYWTLTIAKVAADAALQADVTKHRIASISWSCGVSLSEYKNGGKAQAKIDQAALALKTLDTGVFFSFFHEFNQCTWSYSNGCASNGDSANCFGPNLGSGFDAVNGAAFVSAWNFIRSEFTRLGVTNVVMVLRINQGGGGTMSNIHTYYDPGPANVDWYAEDTYDTTNTGFAANVTAFYNVFCGQTKPCFISETAEPNCSTYTQAAFLNDVDNNVPSTFPNIKALAWFDAVGARANWTFDSCGGLTRFESFANESQWLGGTH